VGDRRNPQIARRKETLGQTEAHPARACFPLCTKVGAVVLKDLLHELSAAECKTVPEAADAAAQKVGQRHPAALADDRTDLLRRDPGALQCAAFILKLLSTIRIVTW